VRVTAYAGARGYEPFAKWARAAIDAGDPVLAGVKILPTEHPSWGLDHFVLVVGYGDLGMRVNTTWGHREWVGDTTTPGLSLANAFYGLRLRGQSALPPGARAARLELLEEGVDRVNVRVICTGLGAGAHVRFERRGRPDASPEWSEDATATGEEASRTVTIPAGRVARFRCTS
jgi:hypothetical protein